MTAIASAPALTIRRPVAWHRLAWVTWRRYRFTLVAMLAVVGVLALELVYSGHQIRTSYDQMTSCTPAHSAQCQFLIEGFLDRYRGPGFIGPVLTLLPGILGAFAGAPIIARELESGTFRYAWTQGVGRMRWAVALLVPGAVGVAALIGGLGALIAWRQQPLVAYGASGRLQPAIFPTTGIAAAAWALLGFALGTVAGVLWRRVLPALASAFAAWFVLAYVAAVHLRDHYLTPLRTTSLHIPAHVQTVSQWWTKGGVRVDDSQINRILETNGARVSGHSVKVHVAAGGTDPIQALVRLGYRQVTTYQPDSRYWSLQWIEAGWLTALSLALLGLTFWLLRRRSG